MDKKIGLFWLRDDFRISRNNGLAEASRNHDQVVAFFLYKKLTYKYKEAQKWWLSKSLSNFKQKLSGLNISLQTIETESLLFDFLQPKSNLKPIFKKLLKQNTKTI